MEKNRCKAALVATLVGLSMLLGSPSAAPADKYGKRLVAQYSVPPEVLLKYDSFKPGAPSPHESKLVNVALADAVEWSGPRLDADSRQNPYNVVVTLSGVAAADGDVASMWQVGWRLEDGQTVHRPLTGLGRSSLKAGDTFRITAQSPTSFKQDRSVAVYLGMVNARNMRISSVEVDVWSGIGGASFLDLLLSSHWLLVGLALLALWYFWFRPGRG